MIFQTDMEVRREHVCILLRNILQVTIFGISLLVSKEKYIHEKNKYFINIYVTNECISTKMSSYGPSS